VLDRTVSQEGCLTVVHASTVLRYKPKKQIVVEDQDDGLAVGSLYPIGSLSDCKVDVCKFRHL
jgi:hypothetical protein